MSTIQTKTYSGNGHRNYRVQIERYESAAEVVSKCKERKVTDSSFHDMAKHSIDKSWHGVENYNEALELLKNGYQPVVENMRGVFKATMSGSRSRFTFQNNVCGFAPVIPLALKGVPNSMIDMTIRPMKTKVIDVYYDITNSAGTSVKEIMENGKILLGAITELEAQGYRFNLYAVQTYCDKADADMLVVKVKSSTQPLDLKRISFPLCHTAFFRVVGFDWYSKVPNGKYRGAYGHAAMHEFGSDTDKFYKSMFGQNAVCISGARIKENGKKHIKEVLTNDESKN